MSWWTKARDLFTGGVSTVFGGTVGFALGGPSGAIWGASLASGGYAAATGGNPIMAAGMAGLGAWGGSHLGSLSSTLGAPASQTLGSFGGQIPLGTALGAGIGGAMGTQRVGLFPPLPSAQPSQEAATPPERFSLSEVQRRTAADVAARRRKAPARERSFIHTGPLGAPPPPEDVFIPRLIGLM